MFFFSSCAYFPVYLCLCGCVYDCFVCTKLPLFKTQHWSVIVRKGWETVCMLSWLHAGLFNWKSMVRKTDRQIQWELKYKWNTTILVSISYTLFSYICEEQLQIKNALYASWEICGFIWCFSSTLGKLGLWGAGSSSTCWLTFILKYPSFDRRLICYISHSNTPTPSPSLKEYE